MSKNGAEKSKIWKYGDSISESIWENVRIKKVKGKSIGIIENMVVWMVKTEKMLKRIFRTVKVKENRRIWENREKSS